MAKFKKVLSIGTTILAALTIAGCSSNKTSKVSGNKSVKTIHQQKKPKPKVADYPNIKDAEADLSKGKNLKGKTVQFKIKKFEPQSSFGYNMETGKHLNFVSPENPNAKKGDTVFLKIKKVKSVLGSFVITYSDLSKVN
ncbi:YgdI/YgdR family lipoprotein [Lactobacillus kullabergensis]|uniref:hypothetical protein n=1 Tax=Lactobacillus kullabergensis TaxID=1218493 RepID=UPI002245DDBF|nr:hypothetical protein [Lactobacillus kullabergensis]MCX0290678.1 YgdI/YgdR family lipoprotein [Lactobacillus kullabergensis]